MRKEIGLPVSIVLALLALVSIWTSMDFYAIGRESGLGKNGALKSGNFRKK